MKEEREGKKGMVSTERGAEKGFFHIYSSLRTCPIGLFEESEPIFHLQLLLLL